MSTPKPPAPRNLSAAGGLTSGQVRPYARQDLTTPRKIHTRCDTGKRSPAFRTRSGSCDVSPLDKPPCISAAMMRDGRPVKGVPWPKRRGLYVRVERRSYAIHGALRSGHGYPGTWPKRRVGSGHPAQTGTAGRVYPSDPRSLAHQSQLPQTLAQCSGRLSNQALGHKPCRYRGCGGKPCSGLS